MEVKVHTELPKKNPPKKTKEPCTFKKGRDQCGPDAS